MNDFLTLVIAGGLTYGISQACAKAKPKPPKRPHATIQEPPRPRLMVRRPLPDTDHVYPMRPRTNVVRDAIIEAQKQPVAPRKQRAPRHSASGPFGMSQEQFKQARKSAFIWSVGNDAPEWDGINNGWLDDESISEEEEALASYRDEMEREYSDVESINPEGEQNEQ